MTPQTPPSPSQFHPSLNINAKPFSPPPPSLPPSQSINVTGNDFIVDGDILLREIRHVELLDTVEDNARDNSLPRNLEEKHGREERAKFHSGTTHGTIASQQSPQKNAYFVNVVHPGALVPHHRNGAGQGFVRSTTSVVPHSQAYGSYFNALAGMREGNAPRRCSAHKSKKSRNNSHSNKKAVMERESRSGKEKLEETAKVQNPKKKKNSRKARIEKQNMIGDQPIASDTQQTAPPLDPSDGLPAQKERKNRRKHKRFKGDASVDLKQIQSAWSNPQATVQVLTPPIKPKEECTPKNPSVENPGGHKMRRKRKHPSPTQSRKMTEGSNKIRSTSDERPPASKDDTEFPSPSAAMRMGKKNRFSYLDAASKPQQVPKDYVPWIPPPLSHSKNQQPHKPQSVIKDRSIIQKPLQKHGLAVDSMASFSSKKDQSLPVSESKPRTTTHKPSRHHSYSEDKTRPAQVTELLTEEEQKLREKQLMIRELLRKYLDQRAPPRKIKTVNLKIEKGKKYSMEAITATNEEAQARKKPTKLKKIILQEREDMKERYLTTKRRVREYVTTKLTLTTNENVTNLLSKLAFFQKRLKKTQPLKFKQHRRLAIGLKECIKMCKSNRAKALIIAPDIEKISTKGGLDTLVGNALNMATSKNIPIVFALNRRKLGKAINSTVKLSAVCIINSEGAHEEFKKMLNDLEYEKYEDTVPENSNNFCGQEEELEGHDDGKAEGETEDKTDQASSDEEKCVA